MLAEILLSRNALFHRVLNCVSAMLAGLALLLVLLGCAAVAVADAAFTVAAAGVKITAKTVGAVADAVIPDGDRSKKN